MFQAFSKFLLLLVVGTLTGTVVYRSLELSKVDRYVYPSPHLRLETTATPSIATTTTAANVDTPYIAIVQTTSKKPTPYPSTARPRLPLKTVPALDFATYSESSHDALPPLIWEQVACVPGRRQRNCIDPALLGIASGRDSKGLRSAGATTASWRRPWLCEVLMHWGLESSGSEDRYSTHDTPPLLAAQQRRADEIKAVTEFCSNYRMNVPPPSNVIGVSNPSSVVAVALHDGLGIDCNILHEVQHIQCNSSFP